MRIPRRKPVLPLVIRAFVIHWTFVLRHSSFGRSFLPKNPTQPAFPAPPKRVWHANFGLAASGCICSVPSDILSTLAESGFGRKEELESSVAYLENHRPVLLR